jgi:hypothetical protein
VLAVAGHARQEIMMTRPTAQPVFAPHAIQGDRADQADTRLAGRWGWLARVAWVSMTIPTVVLFILAIPLRYSQLTHSVDAVQARLGPLSLSVGIYGVSSVLLEILFVATYWGVAALIFWRKSDDWMVLLVALFLVAFGTDFPPTIHLLGDQQPGVGLFVKLLAAVTYICMDGLGYLFPTGRFVPRWTWALLVIVAVLEVPFNLPPSSPFAVTQWSPWLFLPVALAEFVTPVYAQIYRYRRVSGPVQRQQTKWVVYGVSVALLSAIAFRALIGYAIPTLGFLIPRSCRDCSLHDLR